jgi:predicted  nucleic acid-binding Zn-ribbon protein
VDLAPFLTFSGAVLTAIVTVLGTVYVARSRTKSDLGSSITTGFRELTDQLQEERNQLSEIIKRQRQEMVDAGTRIEQLERNARLLRKHLIQLERTLDEAGLDVPQHDLY